MSSVRASCLRLSAMPCPRTLLAGLTVVLAAAWNASPVWAQDQPEAGSHAGQGAMSMDMSSMQGGSPPPGARDPNAYSDGYDFGPYQPHMADSLSLGSLLMDRLEAAHGDHSGFTAYDLQAWYGRTYDRAVLKAEGEIDSNKIADARTELLWGHALTAYWDTQLGARVDSGDGPNRQWLAFGVQGLAPYWFDVDLTGYLGADARTALRLDTEYDILLTQRLILQPRVEANAYGKSDTRRGIGSGLSDVTAGLRLRYEIRRQFAPYIGVEWAHRVGRTQDLAKNAGDDTSDTRLVAGLRFWF